MHKKLYFLLILALLTLFSLLPAIANDNHQAVFAIGQNTYVSDGRPVAMDAAPFIENGRTLVPVRYLALSLGIPEDKIIWNSSAQTVTLIKDDVNIVMDVGGNIIYINGQPKEIDTAPLIREGRTYLPARYVVEAFGYEVGWDGDRQAVLIGPPGQLPEATVIEAVKTVQAEIVSVTDGDTVVVNLDGREEKVRFIGVNAPEIAHQGLGIQEQPYGQEAAAYTREQLSGKAVWLEFDVQERDKYGRLLAYVWLEPPVSDSEEEVRAKMFNARLLLDGYAQVMTVPPNVKYADLFVKLQQEARESGKGLWGAAAAPGVPSEANYLGNARTKKFHRSDCKWAGEISPGNRVEFRSRDEAVAAGYAPCKVCWP
ncbi:MAG: Thermonuclease precursor [Pelotomaculum sp. PtaB.Bin104]|nr:MAG: Thermonuclease precursor [Pelotomaculum sp. PtaB.Bin104]